MSSPGPRFGSLSVLVCLLLVCVTSSGFADIKQSQSSVVDIGIKRLLRVLPKSGLPISADLKTANEVFLSVTMGCSFIDMTMLAKPCARPQILAAMLKEEEFVSHAQPVLTWSKDEDYAGVRMHYSRAHMWSWEGALDVPLGRIIAGIRKAGFVPHVLLRIPRYASSSDIDGKHYLTRSYNWYDASSFAPEYTVSVSSRLSVRGVVEIAFLSLFVPIVALLGTFFGVIIARNQDVKMAVRRKQFSRITNIAALGSIVVYLPLALVLSSSLEVQKVLDLWLGGPTGAVYLIPLLIAPILVIFLLLPANSAISRRLFVSKPEALAQ